MKLDKCTKVLLLAIVVLLTIIIVRPAFEPKNSYAAKGVEYKVVPLAMDFTLREMEHLQKRLNDFATEGWELILIYPGGIGVFKR